MSAVQFGRPLFAASVVGTVAVVAAVATLFSATPRPRSETIVPTRAEAKSCTALLCSWDDFAPTTSTYGATFGPPAWLAFGSFADCVGCAPREGAIFDPRGFAFGLTKLNGNADAPGRSVSEAARARGESAASGVNSGAGPSDVAGAGLHVDAPATSALIAPPPGTASAEVPVTVNPEPGTVVFLATALFVLVPAIRRQRRG